MNLEDRISRTLKQAGAGIAVEERPAEPIGLPPKPARSGRSRVLALAAGFGVVVVLVGAIAVLRSPADRNPVTGTESLLSVTDVGPLVWRGVDLLPSDRDTGPLAYGPAGWLLVASRSNQINGWTDVFSLQSETGAEWAEITSDGFERVVHIGGMVGHPGGYVASGLYASSGYTVTTMNRPSNFPEPAVWTSADGIGWQLTPLPLPSPEDAISDVVSYRIFDLTVTDEGVVALGTEFDEIEPDVIEDGSYPVATRQILWRTNEQGTWELLEGEPIPNPQKIAAGPAGIVATTSADEVWLSADGTVWDQVGLLEGPVRALVANEDGYLAQTRNGVWFSSEGFTWIPVPALGSVDTVGAGPGGFVVVGPPPGGIWWSPDGERWRNSGALGDLGDSVAYVSYVSADFAALIITGGDERGRDQLVVGTTN